MIKPQPEEAPRKVLVRDPEVQAMDRLSRILNGLAEETRTRVLAWLCCRYGKVTASNHPEEPPY